ncbi:TPA: hypothetical protein OVX26_004241 [Shigella sonnei]|nr:hypothetical protein [Shigella sonnei]EJD0002610.1 hypothetical protein [Shigella sonnei]EJI6673377.1 hypothetical protein [Shigella sonnei]HCV5305406.1 hypothetical protein [Shigella sonnei]HCV5382706.1 hypothetical protein [Shigella sonnei]
MAPDRTTGRDPPQRREARFAKRRCPLHPGGLLPGCRERRPRRDRGGATGENRRHNNGMRWSLVHHSRTGENRENSTTPTTKKSEISSLFYTYLSR